jgi:hypothetical protein
VHRLVANRALVADLHPDGVEKDHRIDRLQGSCLPGGDLLKHRVGNHADQVGRDVEPVNLLQIADDLAVTQAPGVHRDDLVVEIREAALVTTDQLGIEARLTVTRDLQRHLAAARGNRL